MGVMIPLTLATMLAIVVLVAWALKGDGDRKQRLKLFSVGLGALCLAWLWSIPGIYGSERWVSFMALSFILVLVPLAIPWLWRRARAE